MATEVTNRILMSIETNLAERIIYVRRSILITYVTTKFLSRNQTLLERQIDQKLRR